MFIYIVSIQSINHSFYTLRGNIVHVGEPRMVQYLFHGDGVVRVARYHLLE